MHRLQVELRIPTTSRSARKAQPGEHRDQPLPTIEIPVARRHDRGCHGHLRRLFRVSASRFRRRDLHQFGGRGARFRRRYDVADTDHLFVYSPQVSTTHEPGNSRFPCDHSGPGIRVDDVTSDSPPSRNP
jgi:hypothetical protein